jgi:hypothetical protein
MNHLMMMSSVVAMILMMIWSVLAIMLSLM